MSVSMLRFTSCLGYESTMTHSRICALLAACALSACSTASQDARYVFHSRHGGLDPDGLGQSIWRIATDGERVFIPYAGRPSSTQAPAQTPRLSVLRLDDDGEGLVADTSLTLPWNPVTVAVGERWMAAIGDANEAILISVDSDPLTVSGVVGPWTTTFSSDALIRDDTLFIQSARSVVVIDMVAAVDTPNDPSTWRTVLDADVVAHTVALTPTDICVLGHTTWTRRSVQCWADDTWTQTLGISRQFGTQLEPPDTLTYADGLLYVAGPDTLSKVDLDERQFVTDPPSQLAGSIFTDVVGGLWSVRRTESSAELRRLDLASESSRRGVTDLCVDASDVEVVGDHLLVACGDLGMHVYIAE
jgi:hypothetical protein